MSKKEAMFDKVDRILEQEHLSPHEKLTALRTMAKMQECLVQQHDAELADEVSASQR